MVTVIEETISDGWGGSSKEIATFSNVKLALEALAERGYSVDVHGKPIPNRPGKSRIYHKDRDKRDGLSVKMYLLVGDDVDPLPHNRLP